MIKNSCTFLYNILFLFTSCSGELIMITELIIILQQYLHDDFYGTGTMLRKKKITAYNKYNMNIIVSH